MEKEVAEYLRIITQASYGRVEEKLEKYGLVKGQANLLVLIRDHDGLTQKELSEMVGIKYSSMSERLNKLETLGYIERNTHENNSKFKRVFITSSGKMAAVQCRKIQKEFNDIIFKGLSKKDVKQLNTYLDKICDNINSL